MSVGLICEFNPFHNGHKYIIKKARELTDEPIICVMSGPFTQRAEPACADKFSRTKAALTGGADAVVELPVKFATASAELFARGGVNVLKNIDTVSALAFGVETDTPEILFEIAKIKNDSKTKSLIKEKLGQGKSYPSAVCESIVASMNDKNTESVLAKPNNILALEYIEALSGTNIRPLPIVRVGSGFHDKELGNTQYASATALRENLHSADLSAFMPRQMFEDCLIAPPDPELYKKLIMYALRRLNERELADLPGVEQGLGYAIKKASVLQSYDDILTELKSCRYTFARLKRIMLYALLGINKQVMSDITCIKTRILGIKNTFKSNLKIFGQNIIARNSEGGTDFTNDVSVKIDAFADDVYSLLTGSPAGAYFGRPMIVI